MQKGKKGKYARDYSLVQVFTTGQISFFFFFLGFFFFGGGGGGLDSQQAQRTMGLFAGRLGVLWWA